MINGTIAPAGEATVKASYITNQKSAPCEKIETVKRIAAYHTIDSLENEE